ncbi:glycosyltransferase family 2 protein [Prochlorococcus marinus]|uniref:Family 2 glycosyl transferase n=1 Tax=Prochlorococcus marinus XMU1408 TaxID=2213228 RepID=A0A318R4Y6_PROMR|nr:glycosyltransferase family 2 protein [Prochlorococcus marinus]MBW3041753.1 family 2 glycosyl transferase [Prochlorococcus marinus str. XMU1408]PYE02898.1 family 2 glycosyl transferase [Prochlorococcus marinus XMU1408]
MLVSVVIPTYNRLPILKKCLEALENQSSLGLIYEYEIVLVDDGSTDGTTNWLVNNIEDFPHLRLFEQSHGGPALGRNLGVEKSNGDLIVFIDSDLVVDKFFLVNHVNSLMKAWKKLGNRKCFTYGSVINTSNFNNPNSEPFKLQDLSWAYFATGNVAIDKKILEKSGLFDKSFELYGWEDLELGERLRNMGVKLIKCPKAIGYHWHPALTLDQIPNLIRIEKERAKMGLVFYRKHPTLRVKFIIQYTFIHRFLWEILTFGGLINTKTLRPLLVFLMKNGQSGLAMELLRLPLNLISVRQIFREASLIGLR